MYPPDFRNSLSVKIMLLFFLGCCGAQKNCLIETELKKTGTFDHFIHVSNCAKMQNTGIELESMRISVE